MVEGGEKRWMWGAVVNSRDKYFVEVGCGKAEAGYTGMDTGMELRRIYWINGEVGKEYMTVKFNRYKWSEGVRGTSQNEKEYVGGGRWGNHHIRIEGWLSIHNKHGRRDYRESGKFGLIGCGESVVVSGIQNGKNQCPVNMTEILKGILAMAYIRGFPLVSKVSTTMVVVMK